MSGFNELQKIAEQNHRVTTFRHEESGDHYGRGIECLLLAQENQFADRNLLAEAAQCFIAAIKHNRKHAEAYIGMGYLLFLLNDLEPAMQYLEVALYINPQHPDIHALLSLITGKKSVPPPPDVVYDPDSEVLEKSPPKLPDGVSLEELIADILASLEAEKTSTIQASLNEHYIQRLQDKLQDWRYRLKQVLYLAKKTATLSADTLEKRLKPLHERIQAYQSALAQSEEMGVLSTEIRENEKIIQAYLDAAEAGADATTQAEIQKYLEVVLDNCDSFADLLDAMESKGYPLNALNNHYQNLIDKIETLEGLLEG